MAESIIFNGVRRFQPGVYAKANADLVEIPGVPQGNLCVIGDFPKLESATPVTYLSQDNIRDQFPDSVNQREMWRVMELCFNPLEDISGSPSSVTFVNARSNTRAEVGIFGGNITMEAPVWGTAGNRSSLTTWWDAANSVLNTTVKAQGRPDVSLSTSISNIATVSFTNATGAAALTGVSLVVDNENIDETSSLTISTSYSVAALAAGASTSLSGLAGGGRFNSGTVTVTGAGTVTIFGKDEVGADIGEEVVATVGGAESNSQFSLITSIENSGASALNAGDVVISGSFGSWKLADYPTLESLVAEINSIPSLSASYLVGQTMTALDIDSLTANLLSGAASITNKIAAIVKDLNEGAGVYYGTWTRLSSPAFNLTTAIGQSAATATVFRCGGGTEGAAITLADFQAALASVENVDVHVVAIDSDDDDVHGAVATHITNSIALGRERNAWLGEAANLPLTTLGDKARALNSKDIALVGQEISVKFTWGQERLNPSKLALMLAAAQCSTNIATPLTRKVLNRKVVETFQAWERQKDIDIAIQRGLVVLARGGVNNDLRVERSVTTWLRDNNPIFSEVSANDSVNACLRDLRRFLDGEIGSAIKGSALARLQALATQRLNLQVSQGIISAYRNLRIRIVGATALISFELAAVEPLNFILIEASVGRFSA